ncbi:hypothetical protein MMC25_006379 [Agyrium rufum]|nr:hypothetical protein [Agyrium rufum]
MAMVSHNFSSMDFTQNPGFFTAAIAADANDNPFDSAFNTNNTNTPSTTLNAVYPARDDDSNFLQPSKDNFQSLFGFSPRLSPQPTGASGQTFGDWSARQQPKSEIFSSSNSFQAPSPPLSAHSPSGQWSHQETDDKMSQVPTYGLETQGLALDPRMQYGHVTPPDDVTPPVNLTASKNQSSRKRSQPVAIAQAPVGGKRKRTSQTSETTQQTPPKRSRKSIKARANQNMEDDAEDSGRPGDEKRSKFLERNRVAASKCRQKKKEWTSGLEQRARELQNDKAQLALMVSSLREEMMFLKGEILNHTNCGSKQITDYLALEADHIASGGSSAHQRYSSKKKTVANTASSRVNSIVAESMGSESSRQSSAVSTRDGNDIDNEDQIKFKSENDLDPNLSSSVMNVSA